MERQCRAVAWLAPASSVGREIIVSYYDIVLFLTAYLCCSLGPAIGTFPKALPRWPSHKKIRAGYPLLSGKASLTVHSRQRILLEVAPHGAMNERCVQMAYKGVL